MLIQNPVKHLRWSVLAKFSSLRNYFRKTLQSYIFDRVLDMPQDYLSSFAVVIRGIRRKVDKCLADYSIHFKLRIFPYSCKYNIQTNERLTKVKEKCSAVKFDVVFPFIFFFQMSQTISVINRSSTCCFLHALN